MDPARFYLGTHEQSWSKRAQNVRLFMSRRRIARLMQPIRTTTLWALDSGGFSELSLYGEWRTTPQQYAQEVVRWQQEMGNLERAAAQDWMCEPHILKKTKKTIREHQTLTVRSILTLRELAPSARFVPVLQGWKPDDYLQHWEMYHAHGIDLEAESLVGIGSICRRQQTGGIAPLVAKLHRYGLKLHGFGLKMQGLEVMAPYLWSADSMAWSFQARKKQTRLPGCAHATCGNCMAYALQWRKKVLDIIRRGNTTRPAQQALFA